MAFKTFTAGSVLTAADVNTYLMGQSVIACTSGTRPASPVAGMTIFETDTKKLLTYDGTAFQFIGGNEAWTVTTASWSATTSVSTFSTNVMRYRQLGKQVEAQAYMVASSTATSGTMLGTAPTSGFSTATANQGGAPIGTFSWVVAATGNYRTGLVFQWNNSNIISFRLDNTTGLVTSGVAVGDSLAYNLSYETA